MSRRACVIGVGLVGASVARGLRRSYPGMEVVGIDKPATLAEAHAAGIIDDKPESLKQALEGTELVILAAPVLEIVKLLPKVASLVGPDTLVTDVGSTKRKICHQAQREPEPFSFVGGHPMAGGVRSGPQGASAELLEGARWILCPVGQSGARALPRIERLVIDLGAIPTVMTPEEHDRAAARLSHLPQLLAMSLMELGSGQDHRGIGPAFFEMTRLAGSSAAIWADILASNEDEIREAARDWSAIWSAVVEDCLSGRPEDAFRRANQQRAVLERT